MIAAPPAQNRPLGIALRLGAALCFAIMAALIKLGYDRGAHIVETIFFRFAFGVPPLLAWIAATGRWDAWRTRRPRAHLTRAAIGLTAMSLSFASLGFLPLAEATTISFAAPLFGTILAASWLREPVGRHRWTAVLLGFGGVLVVMRPDAALLPLAGVAVALLAAVAVAWVTVAIRSISRTDAPETTVLWFTATAMLVVGAAMPAFAQPHDLGTFAVLAGIGLAGGVGQLLMTSSLRLAPVATLVPFDYTQLIWAVLLGWLIWRTQPPPSTLAGAAIIVAGGLYTIYREHRLGRERAREPVI